MGTICPYCAHQMRRGRGKAQLWPSELDRGLGPCHMGLDGIGQMTEPRHLTAERLRDVLEYEPTTGRWTWKNRRSNRSAGQEAGCVNVGDGYMRIQVDRRNYLSARLAWLWMTGEWPKNEIDHKNLSRADDRWINLRGATRSQNQGNRPANSDCCVGRKGVTARGRKWRAHITFDGASHYLGTYQSIDDASAAYAVAAAKHFGEFARVS